MQTLQYLESSPFFAGIMMLVLNIGSRYITHEYSDDDEEYRQNILLRRIAIFAACFVGTRSVITSILLTAGFVILAQGVSSKNREGMANKQTIEKEVKKVDPDKAAKGGEFHMSESSLGMQ